MIGDVAAWWGAIVATIVALVQLKDRLRPVPHITCLLSSSASVGNQIGIINPQAAPIIITHWRVFWGQVDGFNLRVRNVEAEADLEDLAIITLAPHGHKILTFIDGNHFGWGVPYADGNHLYIELSIVGRKRPLVLHAHNPDPDNYSEPRSLRRLLPYSWRPLPRGP